jgi:hypothetical protein
LKDGTRFLPKQEIELRNWLKHFLDNLGDDIHHLIYSNDDLDSDDYCGLDRERDTQDEVETVIRFSPEVLTRRGGQHNAYPIQLLAFTRNAA